MPTSRALGGGLSISRPPAPDFVTLGTISHRFLWKKTAWITEASLPESQEGRLGCLCEGRRRRPVAIFARFVQRSLLYRPAGESLERRKEKRRPKGRPCVGDALLAALLLLLALLEVVQVEALDEVLERRHLLQLLRRRP